MDFRDWAAGLPEHILDLIFGKFVSDTDCLRFGAVCVSWHSIVGHNFSTKQNKLSCQRQLPLLLFPDEEDDTWSIYSVLKYKFLDLKLSLSYKRRFSGSSEGWLVVGNENHTVTLHRPDFIAKEENSRASISIDLPCLFPPLALEDLDLEDFDQETLEFLREDDSDYHVLKALITSDPLANPDNCTIVVIFGGYSEIAFIRYNKDSKWFKVAERHFHDILHYKNKIYALGFLGSLVSIDTADPSTIKSIAPDFPTPTCSKRYLVESCGELLQVQRVISFDGDVNRSTSMIRVYRMDFDKGSWIEKENLGGAALFVGDNTSISVLASDFNGCHPNCVYFTQDEVGINSCKGSDLGIYNVESRSFDLHYTIDPTIFFRMVDRPPIWVVPIPKV